MKYRVWIEDYHSGEGDAVEVEAGTAQSAARIAAEQINKCDHGMLFEADSGGCSFYANVIAADGEVTVMTVSVSVEVDAWPMRAKKAGAL